MNFVMLFVLIATLGFIRVRQEIRVTSGFRRRRGRTVGLFLALGTIAAIGASSAASPHNETSEYVHGLRYDATSVNGSAVAGFPALPSVASNVSKDRRELRSVVFRYDAGNLLRVSQTSIATKSEAGLSGACHSFRYDTTVLMADGTRKRIGEVKVGDRVLTTDPVTGETVVRAVTDLHVNRDSDLADVTVTDGHGSMSTIHTTQHHRFFDEKTTSWVEAARLHAGEVLHDLDGDRVEVVGVRALVGLQTMYDLTIDGVHTYYVAAGEQDVLVHNCGETYENPGHHDPNGGPNPYNPSKGVLPADAEAQFANSLEVNGTRWTKVGTGKDAVYYRYFNDGNGNWHFSGSTNGLTQSGGAAQLPVSRVPIAVRRG